MALGSVEGTMRVQIDIAASKAYGARDIESGFNFNLSKTHQLVAASCDALFHVDGSLADAANTEIDLQTVVGPDGVAINLTKIMALFIANTTVAGATKGKLIVGGAGANAWEGIFGAAGDKLLVQPNTSICFPFPEGLTVDGTHKMLKLEHDGTGTEALTYEVAVVGEMT